MLIDQNIFGLDISMSYFQFMQIADGLSHLPDNRPDRYVWHGPIVFGKLSKSSSAEMFHHYVYRLISFKTVDNFDDRWMLDTLHDFYLSENRFFLVFCEQLELSEYFYYELLTIFFSGAHSYLCIPPFSEHFSKGIIPALLLSQSDWWQLQKSGYFPFLRGLEARMCKLGKGFSEFIVMHGCSNINKLLLNLEKWASFYRESSLDPKLAPAINPSIAKVISLPSGNLWLLVQKSFLK